MKNIFKENKIVKDIKKYHKMIKIMTHLKEAIEKDEYLNEVFFGKEDKD